MIINRSFRIGSFHLPSQFFFSFPPLTFISSLHNSSNSPGQQPFSFCIRYVEEMKASVKDITNKFADGLDLRERWHHQQLFQGVKAISNAIRTLSVLRRDIEDARELVKGVHVVDGIGPTSALSEAAKCLGLKWNLKGCQLNLTGNRLQGGGDDNGIETGKAKTVEDNKEEENENVNGENDKAEKEPPTELPADDMKTDEEKKNEVKGKEIDELENLTEEERRKRRKIMRLKEKLAAASGTIEKKDTTKDKDKGGIRHKEKRSDKEKGEKEAEVKEKENDPEGQIVAASSPPRDVPSNNGDINPKPERGPESADDAPKSAAVEGKEESSNLRSEPSFPARIEPLPKNNPDAASALKKPRSHSSRHSLKKSKTVTFMCPPEDTTSENVLIDNTTENIKGLDLETSRLTQAEKDNKEREAGTGRVGEREERQDKSKEDYEKNRAKEEFEMEPEEKERIATELLQVGGGSVLCDRMLFH